MARYWYSVECAHALPQHLFKLWRMPWHWYSVECFHTWDITTANVYLDHREWYDVDTGWNGSLHETLPQTTFIKSWRMAHHWNFIPCIFKPVATQFWNWSCETSSTCSVHCGVTGNLFQKNMDDKILKHLNLSYFGTVYHDPYHFYI